MSSHSRAIADPSFLRAQRSRSAEGWRLPARSAYHLPPMTATVREAQERAARAGEEARAGREAVERLCNEWPDVSWIEDASSEAYARAAIERLAELMREERPLFRASREGSQRGAETLRAQPFDGLLEALQNADDQKAREFRLTVRQLNGRRELLIAHDGEPVRLGHAGAMVLPWVTTKADDPDASGRFGIGQKTLHALGGPIEVHCRLFHFRIEADGPVFCEPISRIPGLYDPKHRETLVLVQLHSTVAVNAFGRYVEDLGSRALLFLGSVRRSPATVGCSRASASSGVAARPCAPRSTWVRWWARGATR